MNDDPGARRNDADRLAAMLAVVQSVAAGNLSARVDKEQNDVLGMLAVGINMMIDEIEELIEQEQLRQRQLLEAKEQLEMANRQLTQRNAHLSDTAAKDSLTGLINHGTFMSRLDQALSVKGGRLALVLLDIDHFKSFNDRFGHQAGDAAICAVAAVLQRGVRGIDFAARIGGEEFAVVLHDCDMREAAIVAERIRRDIARAHLDHVGRTKVTASFGVSASTESDSRSTLIDRADVALYASKHNGRNCVTCQDDLNSTAMSLV